MRLQIKATGFELTPSLRQFVEERAESLKKYIERWDQDDGVLLKIEIAKNTKHHNKGNVFYAEANLDLPGVSVVRIEETDEKMHAAIDRMKDRLKNEILKLKDKEADHKIK